MSIEVFNKKEKDRVCKGAEEFDYAVRFTKGDDVYYVMAKDGHLGDIGGEPRDYESASMVLMDKDFKKIDAVKLRWTNLVDTGCEKPQKHLREQLDWVSDAKEAEFYKRALKAIYKKNIDDMKGFEKKAKAKAAAVQKNSIAQSFFSRFGGKSM